MDDYTAVIVEARARGPVVAEGDARFAYAIVERAAWQLAPRGFVLVAATPGDPTSYGGVRVDRLRAPTGEEIRVLDDPLERMTPVWEPGVAAVGAGGTPTLDPAHQPSAVTPTAPGTLGTGQLTIAGRAFAIDGQVQRLLVVNGVSLLGRYAAGDVAGVDAWLDAWQDRGATAVRFATTLGGPAWDGTAYPAEDVLAVGPATSGYAAALDALLTNLAARQLTTVLTAFGPGALTGTNGTAIYDEREGHLRWLAAALAAYPRVLVEIAYEPAAEGWPKEEILAHLETWRALDPARLTAFGAEVGAAADSVGSVRTGRWLAVHPDRGGDMTVDGWAWVRRLTRGTYLPAIGAEPALLLQPMAAGDPGALPPTQVDALAERYYAYGLLGGVLGWETGFSCWTTLRTTLPTTSELACADEWLLGAGRVRLGPLARFVFRVDATSAAGTTPFAAVGEADGLLGRHDGTRGEAVVLDAGEDWTPLLKPGWTATVERAVGTVRLVTVARG